MKKWILALSAFLVLVLAFFIYNRAHRKMVITEITLKQEEYEVVKYESFKPGELWIDDQGHHIQAHGGGILYDEKTKKYYWYGENKAYPDHYPRNGVIGMSCYSSTDLYNWKYEGLALSAVTDPDAGYPLSDLKPDRVFERPKVIYNDKTKKYVMWAHIESPDYSYARAGVAISDSPTGPFTYLGSERPNGQMSRDMTLFKDDDGTAYLIYASEHNRTLYISKLTDDYLKQSGEYVRVFIDQSREAPAIIKHEGKYYMVTSACTGWAPNEAKYAVADNIFGPWTEIGNPCIGENAHLTFYSQSTFILPMPNQKGRYIFMADRWNPKNLGDSRYVWLPLDFYDGKMVIEYFDEWSMENTKRVYAEEISVNTTLNTKPGLPHTIDVLVEGEKGSYKVEWEYDKKNLGTIGQFKANAKILDLNVTKQIGKINVYPANLIYFVDCAPDESKEYLEVKKTNNLLNSVSDKAYGVDPVTGKSWGYEKTKDIYAYNENTDMFSSVRADESQVAGNGVKYKFEVPNETYKVYVGLHDPWANSGRYMNLEVNGEVKEKDFVCPADKRTYIYDVTVNNGEITVDVLRSEKSTNNSHAPLVSFIMIGK